MTVMTEKVTGKGAAFGDDVPGCHFALALICDECKSEWGRLCDVLPGAT